VSSRSQRRRLQRHHHSNTDNVPGPGPKCVTIHYIVLRKGGDRVQRISCSDKCLPLRDLWIAAIRHGQINARRVSLFSSVYNMYIREVQPAIHSDKIYILCSPSANFISSVHLTMASSYIYRQRIKLWLSAMDLWAFIRRRVHSLSMISKARYRFLASSVVVFLMLAVLASLVAGGSNEPYAATMMEKQGNRDFNNTLRLVGKESDVKYGQGQQGKIVLIAVRMNQFAIFDVFIQFKRIYGLHPALVTKI
jgi:hypothetical protein